MTSQIGGAQAPEPTSGELLAAELAGTLGGTIGPDGALYVAESALGTVTRIDPETGEKTTVTSAIPADAEAQAGGVDLVFVDETLYVLTTGFDGSDPEAVNGIYEVEDEETVSLVADLGAFALDNPVDLPDAAPTGNPYAIDVHEDGFLVTDGNHNRVYHVTFDGEVSELIAFDNIVPTGLEVDGETIYMSEIGPFPHTAETGVVVSFTDEGGEATEVASGVPYIIDVEMGEDGTLYALSFGNPPTTPEEPAEPFTGKLLLVNEDGTFSVLVDQLMLPTSLDFSGDSAFIVTLTGEAWRIDDVSELQVIEPTPTPSETETEVPTEEPTETATAEPTETSEPTATATSVPPTATATTPPPTATSVPPTATPTRVAPGPPDTGTGGSLGGGSSQDLWLVLGAATLLLLAGSGFVAAARTK